ncbi:MAG: ComEC/Rec2 family competence protein [Verrucomicrobia bacterium]|nr:ComEC/Rec2 family competence protein [Verrucomicrobiota bacterium]
MKQPLILVALGYGAGVLTGHLVEAPLAGAFPVALALTLVALGSEMAPTVAAAGLLFLLGWINLGTRTAVVSPYDLRLLLNEPRLVTVRARVVETPTEKVSQHGDKEKWRTLATLDVSQLRGARGDWQPAFGRIICRTAGLLNSNIVAGQRVEVTGVAQQPEPPLVAGTFDYRRHLELQGVYHELRVESARDWRLPGLPQPPTIAERFRVWGQRTLAHGLPYQDEPLRLQWAMLLGWETALTTEVSEPFMRSGTMHIFAISGLHIALIAGIFVALLRALALPRIWCGVLVIPVLWFYTAATGWQASAIRSTVMMSVILLGWSMARPASLLNSLAVAACLILVWQPEQLFQAGFQLSFFVVLGIALLSPPIEKFRVRMFQLDPLVPYALRPWWQKPERAVGAGVEGVCHVTRGVHRIRPAHRALLSPLHPGQPAGESRRGSGKHPGADQWPGRAGHGRVHSDRHGTVQPQRMVLHARHDVAESHRVHAARRVVSYVGARPAAFTLYYGALLAACAGWFQHRVRRRLAVGGIVALAATWSFMAQRARGASPHGGAAGCGTRRVGGATPGRRVAFDSGNAGTFAFTLKPFLQSQGVNVIPHFMLTAGEARQIGGTEALLELFPARRAWSSPNSSRSPSYVAALSALERTSRLSRSATNGATLGPWDILHPQHGEDFRAADDDAVVALGEFDGVRVLLAANLGKAGQNALLARHPKVQADIVIAGWPGQGEPLAPEWIAALAPKLIVLMDAGRPVPTATARALEQRLRRSGATVLSARDTGSVNLRLQAGRWRIRTTRHPDWFNTSEVPLAPALRALPGSVPSLSSRSRRRPSAASTEASRNQIAPGWPGRNRCRQVQRSVCPRPRNRESGPAPCRPP